MPPQIRYIKLSDPAHTGEMLDLLAKNGIRIDPGAIEYARQTLSDDWLTLLPSGMCTLTLAKYGESISLSKWAEIVQALFELRAVSGIREQARRLTLRSHEVLDTALVVAVAGRYQKLGWKVSFEPNGCGCSDLRLDGSGRYYIEVKRENTQEHKRPENLQARARTILEMLPNTLIEWLQEKNLRVEVKLACGFSDSIIKKLVAELDSRIPRIPTQREGALVALKDSHFIVLHKKDNQYYEKGLLVSRVIVERAGTPVQLSPCNMPIQIWFDWKPNLTAVRNLLKKASSQLFNDSQRDVDAKGFIVLEATGGDQVKDAIVERFFRNLPDCCLGITLLGWTSYVIPRLGLSQEITELMGHAGRPRSIGSTPPL